MNLLVSYNWIKEHVAFKGSAEEFARRLSLGGPSVERLYPQAEALANMVVGSIIEVRPHPNADKLRIAALDLGKLGKPEVVCGGSNLAVGMKVAVARVGAKVKWHGEGELIELKPAEIRGVKSDGMICAASEIGLGDAFPHAEREIIDLSWCAAKPGTPLAEALELDDVVMDVEVTTNRPDAFSTVGLAREASAILGAPFLWKPAATPKLRKGAAKTKLSAKNQAAGLCARYQAVAVSGVSVGPSPWWMKKRLLAAGVRPINTVVDVTNYVMLELGQPMHAFDYAKIKGGAIVVRKAKAGERLAALDGKTYELAEGQLVIADAEKALAIAGVIGGEDSGVREGTTTVVFESATFDPVSVRRTARAHNIHTDASLRFEKGLPEEQTSPALARAVELCMMVAGGAVASEVVDVRAKGAAVKSFAFRPERASATIGVGIPSKRMRDILTSLGFTVTGAPTAKKFAIRVPYWRRRDVEGERDCIEEVARVYGYHNLPAKLPTGELPSVVVDPVILAEMRLKERMRAAGFTELYHYSFVAADVLERAGIAPASAVAVANPLTSDFAFMRTSLIPSALATIAANQGMAVSAELFESAMIYKKRDGAELPEELPRVCAYSYGPGDDDRQFRKLKGALEAWCMGEGKAELTVARIVDDPLWHPGRSVAVSVGGTRIGMLGEIHPAVLAKFGVDHRVAAFDIDLAAFVAAPRTTNAYRPVPQFPPVLRDAAFVIDEGVEYAAVESTIRATASAITAVEPFDVYRGKGIGDGKKSLAMHLTFVDPSRTLTAEEVDAALAKVAEVLKAKLGADLRE